MEDKYNSIIERLPMPIFTLMDKFLYQPVMKGKLNDEGSRTNIAHNIFLLVETIMAATMYTAMGVCANSQRKHIVREFFKFSSGKELKSKKSHINFTKIGMGTYQDTLRDLTKLLNEEKKAPNEGGMPAFLSDIVSGLAKKPNQKELKTFGDEFSSVKLSGVVNKIVNIRNKVHYFTNITEDNCRGLINYLEWIVENTFLCWNRHILIVKKDRAARLMERSFFDDTIIPPGHPLEKFRDSEVVLWTPCIEPSKDQYNETIRKTFTLGIGEYIGLFPYILFMHDDESNLSKIGPIHTISKDDPNKINTNGVNISAKFYVLPGKSTTGSDTVLQGPPKNGISSSFSHKKVWQAIKGELDNLSNDNSQSRYFSEKSSPIKQYFLRNKCLDDVYNPQVGKESFSKDAEMCSSTPELGVTFRFHKILYESMNKDTVLFETSIPSGGDEILKKLGNHQKPPPNLPRSFVTKICLSENLFTRIHFLEESDQTSKLLQSEFVVSVVEQGVIVEKEGKKYYPFYVMEKAEDNLRENLQKRIGNLKYVAKDPPINSESIEKMSVNIDELTQEERLNYHLWILRILRSVGYAINALHKCGVVHRDIKLENILLFGQGRVRLADLGSFGFVGHRGQSVDYRSWWPATKPYIPPEYWGRADPHQREYHSDIFSFGVLVYVLIAGLMPALKAVERNPEDHFFFDDVAKKTIKKVDKSFHFENNSKISLCRFIQKCTQREPCNRHDLESMQVNLRDIEKHAQSIVQTEIKNSINNLQSLETNSDKAKEIRLSLYNIIFNPVICTFDCFENEKRREKGKLPILEANPCKFFVKEDYGDICKQMQDCFEGLRLCDNAKEKFFEIFRRIIGNCPGLLYSCGFHVELRECILNYLTLDIRGDSSMPPSQHTVFDEDLMGKLLTILIASCGGQNDKHT